MTKRFQTELEKLKKLILSLGAIVEEAVRMAIQAIGRACVSLRHVFGCCRILQCVGDLARRVEQVERHVATRLGHAYALIEDFSSLCISDAQPTNVTAKTVVTNAIL